VRKKQGDKWEGGGELLKFENGAGSFAYQSLLCKSPLRSNYTNGADEC